MIHPKMVTPNSYLITYKEDNIPDYSNRKKRSNTANESIYIK